MNKYFPLIFAFRFKRSVHKAFLLIIHKWGNVSDIIGRIISNIISPGLLTAALEISSVFQWTRKLHTRQTQVLRSTFFPSPFSTKFNPLRVFTLST